MRNIAHDYAKPNFFFLYVCFVAVWLGLTDINDVLLGSTEEWLRSFLFLPHAVRVLSAVYLGWAAVPGLFLAHVFSWYLIFGEITWVQLLPILVSACGCNIAVLILQSSYIGPRKTDLRSFNEGLYRHVFLVGLLGSLFISTVNGIFLNSPGGSPVLDPHDHAAVHCWRHAGLGCNDFLHRSYQELCARVSEV